MLRRRIALVIAVAVATVATLKFIALMSRGAVGYPIAGIVFLWLLIAPVIYFHALREKRAVEARRGEK